MQEISPASSLSKKRIWRKVWLSLAAMVFLVAGLQFEDAVYSCRSCPAEKGQTIVRLWFVPIFSASSIDAYGPGPIAGRPAKAGHIHQWQYYGGCSVYGVGGVFGFSCNN